jgi:release factor glutamine methyltransferase
MLLKTTLTHITQQLLTIHDKSQASIDAWWILEWITGLSHAQLISKKNLKFTAKQQILLNEVLYKHIDQHMPLQYIFGTVPFLDLTLTIRPPTLIPRPETEEWCSWLIAQLKQVQTQKLTILDLCTGSGCIGLALAHALPYAQVYGVDISDKACTLAQENSAKNTVTNSTILTSDLYSGLPKCIRFDLIVSNPPYLSREEWLNLDPGVKEWEDRHALVAEDNGLAIIKAIIRQAKHWLHHRADFHNHNVPQIALEIGYNQGQLVRDIFIASEFSNITVRKDMAHKDRLVTAGVLPFGQP